IDDGATWQSATSFTGLAAGTYQVWMRDEAFPDCRMLLQTVTLTEPARLIITEVVTEDILAGQDDETGSITIMADGGTPPYIYSIDNGDSWQDGNGFENLGEGVYQVVVADDNGCLADTTVSVNVISLIDATVGFAGPACHGYADGFITITVDDGNEPFEYSIDGGTTFFDSGNFEGLAAGTYEVVVRDAMGYLYLETVVLAEPDPLNAGLTVSDAWCSSLSHDGAAAAEVTGGTAPYTYLWSTGATDPGISGLGPGDYGLLITDENGCELEVAASVGYEHLLEVSLPGSAAICHDEEYELEPLLEQSGSSVVWSWTASPGADPAPVANPVVSPTQATTYSLQVTDENGCVAEAAIMVDLHPLQGIWIGNDTVIFQGSAITLEARGGEFVNYEWAPGTGLSALSGPVTTATVNEPTTYFVFGETAEGCIESNSIFIDIVRPVHPVSGFTPNDDGINDYFEIGNAQDYPDIVVEVFNRSGQRVFYSQGYSDDKRWDGTFNGRVLPVGTYYFVITLNDQFGTRPVTGPVTIVR
ncbi:MAG: hypothetical protein EA408_13835, partial [Marinilabiliales bacterium]